MTCFERKNSDGMPPIGHAAASPICNRPVTQGAAMADEFTPHLNLTKPEVGASDKTCGDKLNANADAIDAAVVMRWLLAITMKSVNKRRGLCIHNAMR